MRSRRDLPVDTLANWELIEYTWCNLDKAFEELRLERSHDRTIASGTPRCAEPKPHLKGGDTRQCTIRRVSE
jgi:hypothetical protein